MTADKNDMLIMVVSHSGDIDRQNKDAIKCFMLSLAHLILVTDCSATKMLNQTQNIACWLEMFMMNICVQ